MLDATNIKRKYLAIMLARNSYRPFPIKQIGTRTCTLDRGNWGKIFPVLHVSLLAPDRKSICAVKRQDLPPLDDIESELEYEVEDIICREKRTSWWVNRSVHKLINLVKWLG